MLSTRYYRRPRMMPCARCRAWSRANAPWLCAQAFEARRFARREDLHVFLQEPEKSFIMAIRQLDHFDEVGLPRLLCVWFT